MINCLMITTTIFTITTSRPQLNPKGPIHENYAVNCLENLATQQFIFLDSRGLQQEACDVQLLTVLISQNLTSPGFEIQQSLLRRLNSLLKFNIEVIYDDRNDFGVEILTQFCIMVVDSVATFDEKLEILPQLDSFNSEALYLIYYSKLEDYRTVATKILEKLWYKFINNAIVLIPKNLEEFLLFTLNFNTKSPHHCLESSGLSILDICKKGKIKKQKKYFEEKTPKIFHNCTLDVVANKIDPFVIDENEGFEITLIKELGKCLNIFFNVTITGEDSWGVKEEDGKWTNGLGRVQEDASLGIGNLHQVPEYDKDFDFTDPHFDSNLVWIVPIAQYVPKWRVLTIIFSWYLWLLCIGLIFICAAILKLTSLSKKEFKSYTSYSYGFLISLQIMLVVPAPKQPKSDLTRTCFISLAIFSIIISSVYTTHLIQVLTQPQREPQVDTLEGVFDKGWDIGGLPVFYDIFNVPEDEKSMEIYDIFQVNESLNIWLTSVADDRDTCTLMSEFFIKYMLALGDPVLVDGKGKPKIFILKEKLFSYSLNMVTMSGFPFLDRINYQIGLMNSFGLVEAMAVKYTYILAKVKEMQEEENNFEKLTLDHLQGAFAILLLGYSMGFVFLLFEILASFVKKRIKQKGKAKKIKRK